MSGLRKNKLCTRDKLKRPRSIPEKVEAGGQEKHTEAIVYDHMMNATGCCI
uniref:Uncharacterized protein n=1 Tax=Arion vulgaris TaxID=1028688 RepID=A0A0B7A6Q5_9EUPU